MQIQIDLLKLFVFNGISACPNVLSFLFHENNHVCTPQITRDTLKTEKTGCTG